jgi:hypothetical protein
MFIKVNGTYILKSGTDFRQFSLVTLNFMEVGNLVNHAQQNLEACIQTRRDLWAWRWRQSM